VSLEAALRSAIETADRVIGVAGHRLTLEPPGAPLALDADKVRIAQVFANLLNNAVKYTAPVGTIARRARGRRGRGDRQPAELPRN